jgi:molybdopterin-guanine dinucleotide biosynthesis protein A
MKRTSLLLAGGLGTRLNGKEKALLPFGDGVLIENTLKILDAVSDEVIISLRDKSQVEYFAPYIQGRKIVTDTIINAGPLVGILDGFMEATGDYIFVVACDMPFIDSGIINRLFEIAVGHDAVIPISPRGKKEPLHSVYCRKSLIPLISGSIKQGDRFVMAPVLGLDDVVYVEMNELEQNGGRDIFANINSPEDMEMLNDVGDL